MVAYLESLKAEISAKVRVLVNFDDQNGLLTYFTVQGHYEYPPYTNDTKRSVYHLRNLEVFRMKQVRISCFLNTSFPSNPPLTFSNLYFAFS